MISKFDDFLLESKEKKTYLQQAINVLSKSKFPLTVDEICDEINSSGEIKIPKTSYRSVSTIVLSYTKGKEDTISAKSRNKSGKVFFEIVNERPQTFKLIENLSQIQLDEDDFTSSVEDPLISKEDTEKMTFVKAAQICLQENGNKPMSAQEIWDQISDTVNYYTKTPVASLITILGNYSDNSKQKNKKKNPIFKMISGRPAKYVLLNPESAAQDLPDETNDYFLLGAYDKNNIDWWKECVKQGKWYNGFALDGEETLKDKVNEIPVGANVAIKSTYTRERVKPAMMIKARGIVTKNYGDGTQLDVDWETDFTPFEIVRNDVGGYRATLHEVNNQEHIDLIWNLDGKDDDEEKEIMRPSDFFTSTTGGKSVYTMKDEPNLILTKPDKYDIKLTKDVEKTKEIEKSTESGNYELNPFRQAICVLGKSGKGKSTTMEKILKSFGEKMDYEFIIPTSSTTNLLSQYSPGSNRYIQSRLGKLIMEAKKNPNKLFTAVFDECHKANVIEMINDELLQSISLYRNLGKRFISVDDDTASLYKGLDMDKGNLLIPNNFGFIFLSSKPNIIIDNADFFNRVDIYVLENQPDKDAVDLCTVIGPSITLSSKYFRSVGDKKTGSKTDSDIDLIKELHK